MGVTIWEICSGGSKLPPVTQRVLEVLPLTRSRTLTLALNPNPDPDPKPKPEPDPKQGPRRGPLWPRS